MPAVVISPKAAEDIDKVFAYVSNELGSPIAAQNVIREIMDAIEKLCAFPMLGPVIIAKNKRLSRYRHLSAKGQIVFYRIETDTIYIVRVLNAQTDYLKVLGISL